MVCLMLDGPRSVRVASTVQPGAAVNLEYLIAILFGNLRSSGTRIIQVFVSRNK